MNKPTHHRTISELTDRGWKIIYNDSTSEAVSIRSVIRHWDKLTWAQQAYYRGKYGFSERGVLDIGISGHSTTPANSGLFFRNPEPAAIAIPEECLPGSNKRLWTILEQSRVGVECNRYDDTALLHTGPDNSVILTNAAGWGLLAPNLTAMPSWMINIPAIGKSVLLPGAPMPLGGPARKWSGKARLL